MRLCFASLCGNVPGLVVKMIFSVPALVAYPRGSDQPATPSRQVCVHSLWHGL